MDSGAASASQFSTLIYADGTLAGIAFMAFLALQVFLWVYEVEVPTNGKKISFSQNFNVLLQMLSLSIVAALACETVLCYEDSIPSLTGHQIVRTIQDVATSSCELAYVYYSWARASKVVEIKMPKVYSTMEFIVRVVPFLLYLQVVPDLLVATQLVPAGIASVLTTIEVVLLAVTALSVVIFDAVLLSGFIAFLRDLNSIQQHAKLYTIVKYGIVSASLALTSVIVYIVASVVATTYFSSRVFATGVYVGFLFIFMALFLMKMALQRQKMANTSAKSTES